MIDNFSIREFLGLAAGVISFVAYLIYIYSTFKGKTKPSRSTWWILTLVGFLIFITSYASGLRESIWIQLSYVLGPLIIAIMSVFPKYGYDTHLLMIDKICLIGAILCGVIWLVFNSPFIALLGSIVVDFIGLIPTIKKSYIDPMGEDIIAWSIEMVATILNAFGIAMWFSIAEKDWIYALYLIWINGLIVMLLYRHMVIKMLKTKSL